VKETGAALFPVLLIGVPFIGWAYGIPRWSLVKRTVPLVVANTAALLALFYFYRSLEWHYSLGNQPSYAISVATLWTGACWLCRHFLGTAPYVVPAFLTVMLAGVWLVRKTAAVRNDRDFCRRMAWTCYFCLFFCAATCIVMPVQMREPRHYLVAAMHAVVASCLAADIGFMLARKSTVRVWRVAFRTMTGVIVALLVLHSIYGLLVGPLGEGRIRHVADAVGARMLSHVARVTPRGGTAYFMTDPSHPEPRENTVLWLRCFHQRGDINCVFPECAEALTNCGVVAVQDYEISYLPNRIPVHAAARRNFLQAFVPRMPSGAVTQFSGRVTHLYADAKGYRGYQFKAKWGIPAFWELKRGSFRLGWCIYAYGTATTTSNLVRNGCFTEGLKGWEYWGAAHTSTGAVTPLADAVRLCSPDGQLAGIRQTIGSPLVSGSVYRLSAYARHVGAPQANRIQGGRVAVYLPPQKELDITWLTQRNTWWLRELVFTNTVAGQALILVHMGYGKVASMGEFTDVRLERVGQAGDKHGSDK